MFAAGSGHELVITTLLVNNVDINYASKNVSH
jgi:hypothetical protein